MAPKADKKGKAPSVIPALFVNCEVRSFVFKQVGNFHAKTHFTAGDKLWFGTSLALIRQQQRVHEL